MEVDEAGHLHASLCSIQRIDRISIRLKRYHFFRPRALPVQHITMITSGALPFLPFHTVSQLCGGGTRVDDGGFVSRSMMMTKKESERRTG